MAWPSTLTDNTSVLKYEFVQGISRVLESGNSYTELHQGVADEIRIWLESEGGVPDADLIENTADFVPAAVNLFLAKMFRGRGNLDMAEEHNRKFIAKMKTTSPRLSSQVESGGIVARVVLLKRGDTHYTERRGDRVFEDEREL